MERYISLLLDLATRTVLAAAIGALAYSFAASHGHGLSPLQVAGVAMMLAPIAIPTACAANLALFLVSKHIGSRLSSSAAIVLVGAICTVAFPIYMRALAPATDWQRATILPLATFIAASALWLAKQPNASQRKFA